MGQWHKDKVGEELGELKNGMNQFGWRERSCEEV